MPSSKNYVRDIPQEKKTAKARGDIERDNERKRARRLMVKEGLVKENDGLDVDHKKPLDKGGSNARSNLRVQSASDNRSFARKKDGSVK